MGVGLFVAACFPENIVWHQKLALEVETPSGLVSGAAVVRVRVSYDARPSAMTGTEVSYELTGEATAVEVSPGRYLFALLDGTEYRFEAAAKDRFDGMNRGERLRAIPRQIEPVLLTGDLIPTLVTFDDVTDPTTVRQVDPKDLTSAFGPGVRLRAVRLQITTEAVTSKRVLGSLGLYPETPLLLEIDPMDFSLEAQLRQGSFISEP